MIKKINGVQLLRKIPMKKAAKKCVFGLELAGALGGSGIMKNDTLALEKVLNTHVPELKPREHTTDWFSAQQKLAEINRSIMIRKADSLLRKQQKAVVTKIMTEDKNFTHPENKEKIAQNIVKVAREYDLDPVHIACIAKEESHFTENIISKNGKGMMQITSITVKDMFLRPDFYHKKLKNITSKYKSPKQLYNDLQTNPLLNLRIGALLYEARLRESGGNIRTALVNYNSSSIKYAYASRIMKDINKYEKLNQQNAIHKVLASK
ncbi:MAG: transglycosylase SLT domain-containing protein [Opitutales bacterium]